MLSGVPTARPGEYVWTNGLLVPRPPRFTSCDHDSRYDDTHTRTDTQVAFWSAALDPNRDESSLSARLSALSGLRSGLTPDTRRQYLAKCVGLVAGARKPGGRHRGTDDHPGEPSVHLATPMSWWFPLGRGCSHQGPRAKNEWRKSEWNRQSTSVECVELSRERTDLDPNVGDVSRTKRGKFFITVVRVV